MIRRYRYVVLALAVLLVVVIVGLSLSKERPAQLAVTATTGSLANRPGVTATQPAMIEAIKPQGTSTTRTATFPGTIEGYDAADLFAKVTGYVSAYHVDIGDRVKAGQELAVISVPELDKEYQLSSRKARGLRRYGIAGDR